MSHLLAELAMFPVFWSPLATRVFRFHPEVWRIQRMRWNPIAYSGSCPILLPDSWYRCHPEPTLYWLYHILDQQLGRDQRQIDIRLWCMWVHCLKMLFWDSSRGNACSWRHLSSCSFGWCHPSVLDHTTKHLCFAHQVWRHYGAPNSKEQRLGLQFASNQKRQLLDFSLWCVATAQIQDQNSKCCHFLEQVQDRWVDLNSYRQWRPSHTDSWQLQHDPIFQAESNHLDTWQPGTWTWWHQKFPCCSKPGWSTSSFLFHQLASQQHRSYHHIYELCFWSGKLSSSLCESVAVLVPLLLSLRHVCCLCYHRSDILCWTEFIFRNQPHELGSLSWFCSRLGLFDTDYGKRKVCRWLLPHVRTLTSRYAALSLWGLSFLPLSLSSRPFGDCTRPYCNHISPWPFYTHLAHYLGSHQYLSTLLARTAYRQYNLDMDESSSWRSADLSKGSSYSFSVVSSELHRWCSIQQMVACHRPDVHDLAACVPYFKFIFKKLCKN